MTVVADPFMAAERAPGIQRGRGGFLRSADDSPYVTDPDGALVKSGERKGQVARLKYGSPSGAGRLIENDTALVKYKQRLSFLGIGMDSNLAEACRDLVLLDADSAEFRTAADSIAVAADRVSRSWLAADRGSHGHAVCERHDLGRDIDDMIEAGEALGLSEAIQRQVMIAWASLLAVNGLEVLAVEAACVDDTWRLAGTLDRVVRLTRDLRFVMPTGELIVVPAATVLILDLKFGKPRRAHPIQIASYAHSLPYDTEAETRGEWPWVIDQTHALIAHGDFGGDGTPVTFELLWVDLTAGREHGGRALTLAKAWNSRDDLWSVSQLEVPGAAVCADGSGAPTTPPTAAPGTQGEGPVAGVAVTAEPAGPSTLDEFGDPCLEGTCPSCWDLDEVDDVYEVGDATRDINAPAAGPSHRRGPDPGPDEGRLALVDAKGALCPSPDEGADWSGPAFTPVWDELKALFDALDPAARSWRSELVGQAQRRGVAFHAQGGRTERRFHINKAVISLALAGDGDDILRALLAPIAGDVAWFLGVEPGHIVGSLGAIEAQRFADLVDQYLSPPSVA